MAWRSSQFLRPLVLLALGWLITLPRPALAQSTAADATPEQIVARLAVTVKAGPEKETESLVRALQAFRDAAIPAITAGLAQKEEPLSMALTRALGGIGGDASTFLLVQLLADGPDSQTARSAVGCLENRPVRRPVSAAELATLTQLVRTDNILGAGHAARVLGKCLMVPATDRLAPILERFESEVVSPTVTESVRIIGTYVSPRVGTLNEFVLGISHIGKEAIPMLEQRRDKAAQSSELRKWLTLALGMAGDESVADDLGDMALGDPDRYVRWVAIRAYARSAKQKAVPLLQILLNDTTESEYGNCPGGPCLLIQMTAGGELSRLKQGEPSSPSSPPEGSSGE